MAGIGTAGRTRRDVSRQANEKSVSADVTALQRKGDRAGGPGTSTNTRPGTGLKKRK